MGVTQPAWKVGDKCPSCGGELVHFRPATKDEFAAYMNRESPRGLPARVDNANPDQVAELGQLYVCTACGYKTRVHPDAGAGDRSGAQTADRAGTRSTADAGTSAAGDQARAQGASQGDQAGASTQGDELQRLRDENARLRTQGGAPQ